MSKTNNNLNKLKNISKSVSKAVKTSTKTNNKGTSNKSQNNKKGKKTLVAGSRIISKIFAEKQKRKNQHCSQREAEYKKIALNFIRQRKEIIFFISHYFFLRFLYFHKTIIAQIVLIVNEILMLLRKELLMTKQGFSCYSCLIAKENTV